jgi:hypothetical protein
MIRRLAKLLLILGLLAMLPGGGLIGGAAAGPEGVKAEAVLDAALRGAEPREQSVEPGDEPPATIFRHAPLAPGHAGRTPAPLASGDLSHLNHAPFRARAPPRRDVPT